MQLINFRRGFACNSSSTHSIISNLQAVTDEFSEFGWGWFKVAPKDANIYIAANVIADGREYDKEKMCKALDLDEASWPDDGGYVDHQSQLSMIAEPSTNLLSIEFVSDLYGWFKQHNAGVLGGNDNEDEPSDWLTNEELRVPSPIENYHLVGRKINEVWAAINSNHGTRVRFAFTDKVLSLASPELVDLKITNYCNFGCTYCYQASTVEGAHAPIEAIISALQDCASAGVLEVAIGGGEPTLHPQFRQIITTAKKLGIIPNVTTRNLNFIRQVIAGEWQDIGGIAFSVDTIAAVTKICGAIALGCLEVGPKFTVQIVDKSIRFKSELVRMLDHLKTHNVQVTWLGFKQTGFGKKHIEVKWNQPDWTFLTDVLPRDEYNYSISVDTAMLSQYGIRLRQKYGKGYDVTASEFEGVNSCYIDCCENIIAKSSYHDNTHQPYISLGTQFNDLR